MAIHNRTYHTGVIWILSAALHHPTDFSTLVSITIYSLYLHLSSFILNCQLLRIPLTTLAIFPQLPSISPRSSVRTTAMYTGNPVRSHLSYQLLLRPQTSVACVLAITDSFSAMPVFTTIHYKDRLLWLRRTAASVWSAAVEVAGLLEQAPGAFLFIRSPSPLWNKMSLRTKANHYGILHAENGICYKQQFNNHQLAK